MIEKKLKEEVSKIYLNTNKEIMQELSSFFDFYIDQIESLKKIDVSKVKPMSRITETSTFLREDTVGEVLKKNRILENAPHSDSNYVIINKDGGTHD